MGCVRLQVHFRRKTNAQQGPWQKAKNRQGESSPIGYQTASASQDAAIAMTIQPPVRNHMYTLKAQAIYLDVSPALKK